MTPQTDKEPLAGRVKAIIARVLRIDVQDLVADKSLKDQGLDSLGLLFLLDELEAEFDIKLIGEQLEAGHFKSAHSITSLLNDNYLAGGH